MQPGMPQGFGTVGPDATPIFTLPGNPVSAFVSFEVFVRPAIRRMLGVEPLHRPMVSAECTESVDSRPGLRQFLRGSGTSATAARRHARHRRPGSHLIADGERELPAGHPRGRRPRRGGGAGAGDGARAAHVVSAEVRLTHVDERGAARMVDVSGKAVTTRTAVASGFLRVGRPWWGCSAARACRRATRSPSRGWPASGRQAHRRPHPAVPSAADPRGEVALDVQDDGVSIVATVRTAERTGVEMEALTAVTVAGLT